MKNNSKKIKPQSKGSPFGKVKRGNTLRVAPQIIQKPLSIIRNDVRTWKSAQAMAMHPDNPKVFPLYNLYDDILTDARLFSQIENRKQKSIGAFFNIKNQNEEINEELTAELQNSIWFNQIIGYILDARYFGYSLIELDFDANEQPTVTLIQRQNVLSKKGIILKDATDDKGIEYRNTNEYGTWLLDFGTAGDIGILNKAVPHILFKKFAQSCWSELCEIYGIPPRVMKTNTRDLQALNRAEQMMRDMAAAAWFIIDDTENFEFASTGTPASGEVYNGLIRLCNDEISLLISGAILGQDTQFGTRGKEQASQDLLQDLVSADQTLVEQYMNDKVLPALYKIGLLPVEALRFEYDKSEDVSELWQRTKEILPYKEVDSEWIKTKFGIEVKDKKVTPTANNLSAWITDPFFD